jgi:hypothetical protein
MDGEACAALSSETWPNAWSAKHGAPCSQSGRRRPAHCGRAVDRFGTKRTGPLNLSSLVFGKTVSLDCGKEESYGRLVFKILLPDREDVCLDQIKAGMAWHYQQFESAQTPQKACCWHGNCVEYC